MYKTKGNKIMLHSKWLYISILFLGFFSKSQAQQDAQFTQYMYNTLSVNPAYAGTAGVFSAMVLHRSQWVGLDGSPSTQTFNIQTPIKNSFGLGFSVINDDIGNGTIQETSFDLAASYEIMLGQEQYFSFGLKASGHILNVDVTKLSGYEREPVPSGRVDIDNKFSPNFGVGLYYFTNKSYVGVSVPNILETKHFDNNESSASKLATERMNFYLIGGYVFEINDKLKLKPAALLKAVRGAPLQLDLSANFILNEKIYLGAAYRWDAAVSALVGFQINDQFMLGLAYDRETTELGKSRFNDGSFEAFLRFELYTSRNDCGCPRYF